MPISRHYDEKNQLLVIEISGEVTSDELVAYAETASDATDAPANTDELVDLRYLSSTFESKTLELVAAKFLLGDENPDTVKVALVVAEDNDLVFGMSRQCQTYRGFDSPLKLQVFTDINEARQWLGLAG